MKKVYPQFYGTIKHVNGHNKFKLDNPSYWEKYLDNTLKEDQRITLVLKPYYKPRTTGSDKDKEDGKGNQNGYYWAVVLPLLAEHFGLELWQMHEEVKLYFLPMASKINPNRLIGGSTQNLNRLEWEDLMTRIRTWAQTEYEIAIPLPREVENEDEEEEKTETNTGIVESEKDPINELIELFKPVNPNYERLYPNKNQRAALERMVKKHGREMVENTIRFLEKSNASKYAPKITTPYVLEAKLGDLIAWAKVQKTAQRKVADLGTKQ